MDADERQETAGPRLVRPYALTSGRTESVVELPIDDSWFRDTGPIYAFDGDARVALDFTFNGWGEKFAPWDADAAVAAAWAAHAGHPTRTMPFVFEGGWPPEFKPGARVRMAAQTHPFINKPGVCGILMDEPLDAP